MGNQKNIEWRGSDRVVVVLVVLVGRGGEGGSIGGGGWRGALWGVRCERDRHLPS